MSRHAFPPDAKTPSQRRRFLLHYCRVLLREAHARRHAPSFHATLLSWAGRARREAAAIDARPAQGELFG